jgi:hypothetical protein
MVCCKDSWLAFIYVALLSKEQWVLMMCCFSTTEKLFSCFNWVLIPTYISGSFNFELLGQAYDQHTCNEAKAQE